LEKRIFLGHKQSDRTQTQPADSLGPCLPSGQTEVRWLLSLPSYSRFCPKQVFNFFFGLSLPSPKNGFEGFEGGKTPFLGNEEAGGTQTQHAGS